jgi:hypothetical protein
VSHNEEFPTYVRDDLNITLDVWTIVTDFPLADSYYLRFIYANNYWETGRFQITTSEQSRNASDTSSYPVPTSHRSSTTLWITESTGTRTSSLAPGTTPVMSPGAAATAATTQVSTSNEINDDGLSTGAKVRIGIGCAAAAIIGLVGLLLLYRMKKKGKLHPSDQPCLPSVNSTNLDGSSDAQKIFEADGKHEAANMPELPSGHYTRSELPG